MMQQWRDDLVAYRCGMPHSRQQEIAARLPGWRCDEVEFFGTRISFAAAVVTRITPLGSASRWRMASSASSALRSSAMAYW